MLMLSLNLKTESVVRGKGLGRGDVVDVLMNRVDICVDECVDECVDICVDICVDECVVFSAFFVGFFVVTVVDLEVGEGLELVFSLCTFSRFKFFSRFSFASLMSALNRKGLS